MAVGPVDAVIEEVLGSRPMLERERPRRLPQRRSVAERNTHFRSIADICADLTEAEAQQVIAAPWEQLPLEPSEVYRTFEAFRALGPRRTLTEAAAATHRLNHRGRYTPVFSNEAAHWAFTERARAWDAHMACLQREAQEREILARQQEVIEHQRVAGRTLREKGLEFLERVGLGTGAEAIRAVAEGVKLERTAEGLPDWVLEVMNASDADLLRRYEELRSCAEEPSALIDGGEYL